MSKQKTAQARYMVSVYDEPGNAGTLRFTFVPKQKPRTSGEIPKPVPAFIASVRENGGGTAFTWHTPPPKPSTQTELEEMARERVTERVAWIQRVSDLVKLVEDWAKEFGWSTKRIDKKIEDSRLGNHKAACLVMQEDTVRVLLEPISASAPGSDGLVDLCLMPGYDDIASLYHQQNGWHALYVFPTTATGRGLKEGETQPLSKKTFVAILGEMKKHAE